MTIPKIVVGDHTITIEHNGEQRTFSLVGSIPDVPADDYFTGGAIKALKDDGELGGYLIVWGSENQRDKQGEFFTPDTELRLDWFKERPILYHHGLDGKLDSWEIGKIKELRKDAIGIYARGQLDINHKDPHMKEAIRGIWGHVKKGALGWSSGSMGHLVEVAKNGQILKWPLVEGSLTPSPAEPHRTKVDAIKLANQQLLDDKTIMPIGETKGDDDSNVTQVVGSRKPKQKTRVKGHYAMLTPEMLEALRQGGFDDKAIIDLQMILANGEEVEAPIEIPIDPIMAEDEDELEEEMKQEEVDEEEDELVNGKTKAKAAQNGNNAVMKELLKMQRQNTKIAKQLLGRKNAPPTESVISGVGRRETQSPLIKRSKWSNLDWRDMLFVKSLLDGASRHQNGQRWLPSDPADFIQELSDKIENEKEYRFSDAAIKSVRAIKGIKADELNYSTQASFGDEFVPDLWRSQLWDTPRLDNPVFRELLTIEMPSDPYNLPIEGGDPTIFAVAETTDENQLNTSDSNAAIPDTKVGTNNTTLASGKLAARIQISAELVEDSIIPVAQHWRFKAVRAMEDARDFVLLSADATTGSSNINNDGSSIGSTNKALYGGGDGILHLPLVGDTTLKVSAGGASPTLANIREARTKLNTEILADFGNLVYFCDPLTSVALASLDEALNFQINGNESSFNTGMVGRLDNIPVFVTSQMSLSIASGVVSATASNNTLGRLLLVHKPSWYVGFRRNVSVNLAFMPEWDAWTLVVSMRMALINRAADVASLLHNIAV